MCGRQGGGGEGVTTMLEFGQQKGGVGEGGEWEGRKMEGQGFTMEQSNVCL
jgi:hypothetical protein